MKYKRVKKIDYDFSVIGYGCWGASGKESWTDHDDDEQIRAIKTAVDSGINFFDVAPIYGFGHAEEVLGKAISGLRDRAFIATKVGVPWNEKMEGRNDVSCENILKEIDSSLKRLNVDYVDLYQVHWPTDKNVPLEETIEAMKQVKEAGKTRYIGLSNYSGADICAANDMVDIVSMQGLYNMFEQNASSYHTIPLQYRVTDEIFPLVQEEGMAFFPYSPLFQGLLAGKITADTVFGENDVRRCNPKLQGEERLKYLNKLKQVRWIPELKGRAIHEIAINYLIAKDEVTSVIATVKNEDELMQNCKSLEWDISDETMVEIDSIVNC